MNTYKIALYPGDGIGVDVTDAAADVLRAVAEKHGDFALDFTRFDWGIRYYEAHGEVAPPDFLEQLRPFDAIFLGALGWPEKLPDNVTLKPLITMRQAFDQWACVRPARTFAGVPTPLRTTEPIDMIVVRENSEGEYVDNGGRFRRGFSDEFAVQTALHTRRGIERALRFGFELAKKRRRRLTMVTKSNAQRYGYTLWDDVLETLKPEFADVEVDKQHIDAISMNFVRRPAFFDVVVGSNLFGDILTDLSGAITGSLGLNPSANLNPEREAPSLFEPVHGSAPDIAGQGIANPAGAILAAGMMLEWLGEAKAAAAITRAVESVLARGVRTPDLGGECSTAAFTDSVIEALSAEA
ncbi:MAG: tartrate dehydrogenase [Verrucomicrobia bacterium]|nr:MAG: tartrate dehydrogenase [Verrucomicrobiota bacterium]